MAETQSAPTHVPDEIRERRARRFALSQTCQGDPDTCGCGGACPMLNAAGRAA